MALKKYKPTSAGRRLMTASDFSGLSKKGPEKSLTKPKKRSGGRNNGGRMTIRQRGGGHKRRYRVIDFRRDKIGVPAGVKAVEYDPNRTARIALLAYADGEKRYILAPLGISIGDEVISGDQVEIKPGNALPLRFIPLGTPVHNIEMRPGKGGQMVRSGGGSAQLLAKEGTYALLRLPSGEIRKVLIDCRATVGQLSNPDNSILRLGKAGRKRWLGIRPTVRGTIMNPIDHPHGGGEGRSGQGNPHPVSPWGVPTKGYKTRSNKRTEKYIVKRRGKR